MIRMTLLPLLSAMVFWGHVPLATAAGPISVPASKYFAPVKPQMSNPKGTQRSGRGVINTVRAVLEGDYLNIYLETPLPVPGDVAYRIWLSIPAVGQKAEPMLAFPLAHSIQIHDLGKFGNVPVDTDTSEGVFLKIPRSSLAARFRAEKKLIVLDVTAVDVKDTNKVFDMIQGAAGVIVAK